MKRRFCIPSLMLCLAAGVLHAQGVITTVAGTDWFFDFEGKQASNVPLSAFNRAAMDRDGNIYIADPLNSQVIRLDRSGRTSVVAGNGFPGFSGDGGPAKDASIGRPYAVAVDRNGNVYVSDDFNFVIRRISPDGVIQTFAGSGDPGFSGDGGPALQATFRTIRDMKFDPSGNLYFTDPRNERVRRIDTRGIITTVAGTGASASTGDSGPATQAALSGPNGIAFDAQGNLYIAEFDGDKIRRVGLDGRISTFAGTGEREFSGDNGPATAASLYQPDGLAFDGAGNLYVADSTNSRVRRINTSGVITTIAGDGSQRFSGDGGPPDKAGLFFPSSLLIDLDGSILVADSANQRLRRIVPGQSITTIAGNGAFRQVGAGSPAAQAHLFFPAGVAFDRGSIYVADSLNHMVRRIDASGAIHNIAGVHGVKGIGNDGRTALDSLLYGPESIAIAPDGRVVIADSGSDRIRTVDSTGTIRTIAGSGAYGDGGDGGQATSARLAYPSAIIYDTSGNLYIADQGNSKIRRVAPNGIITTFAGTGEPGFGGDNGPAARAALDEPSGLARDSAGNIYIGEYGGCRVRRISLSGVITTIAGRAAANACGTPQEGARATQTSLGQIWGVAVDAAGNVFFADTDSSRIWRVGADGILTSAAGIGIPGFTGDGGPARSASLDFPGGLAFDAAGNLLIADAGNDRIRRVSISTLPTFTLSRNTLSFTSARGAAPADQTVTLSASLGGATFSGLPFTATADQPWVHVTPTSGVMPGQLQVGVRVAGLATGAQTANITVRANGANPGEQRIAVSLRVEDAGAPQLSLNVDKLNFSSTQGGGTSSSDLTISNRGAGTLTFRVTPSTTRGGAWLAVSHATGSATAQTPVIVTATVNPQALAAGTYTGAILIEPSAGAAVTVPVNLTVSPAGRVIVISQVGLTFQAVAGGGTPLAQTVAILNSGQSSMNWTASASTLSGSSGWLRLSAGQGTVTRPFLDASNLEVSVNTAGLAEGAHYGRITIAAPGADNSPQTVTVQLNVFPAGSNPGPDLRPTGLVFTGLQGETPGSQAVSVANITGRPLAYASYKGTFDGSPWFTQLPERATVVPGEPGRIIVQPNLGGLATGIRRGSITLQFEDGSIRNVGILLSVGPADAGPSKDGVRSAGNCTPNQLRIQPTNTQQTIQAATGQPVSLEVKVVDNCAQVLTPESRGASVSLRLSNNDPGGAFTHAPTGRWSKTFQTRSSAGQSVMASVTAFQVLPNGTILADQVDVPVTVTGTGSAPLISPGGILNGASFASNAPVSPGQLISIYGTQLSETQGRSAETVPLPTEFSGTEVRLGNRQLPILYASGSQMNVQVPYDLPVNTEHQIVVKRGSTLSVPEGISVAAAQPAIFTKNQSGRGQGIIVDGVTNQLAETGRAVTAGSTVVIYCTGLGVVNPPVPAGAAAPGIARTVNEVTVSIDGRPATVLYSGLTPGFPGLYQINATLPQGIRAGDSVPVTISVAGQTSPPVTIAVR